MTHASGLFQPFLLGMVLNYCLLLLVGKLTSMLSWCIAAVDGKQKARLVGGDKFAVDISGPTHPAAFVKDAMNGWAHCNTLSGISYTHISLMGMPGCRL